MADVFSMISAIAAAIATGISLIALLLNIKQFSKTISLGQLPFLNISYTEVEEGVVPNIISDFEEDNIGEENTCFGVGISNIGSGFARDIWIEYNDNFHKKERYFAFNNVIRPEKNEIYVLSLMNIVNNNDRFEGYDFEINVYYKDLFGNSFCTYSHGVYLTYGDIEIKPHLTFVSQPHKVNEKNYPKEGKPMKYIG